MSPESALSLLSGTQSMTDYATSSLRLVHPTGSATDLYFVRHGQTPANVSHQFAGSTDIPLDDLGKRQAESVAARFRTITIDQIVSSPLQRAHYTAQAIGRITGHTPHLMDGLREMDFGDAEMLTIPEILENYAHLLPALGDPYDLDMQWPNGESRFGFHARVLAAVNTILHDHADKRVAVVCHGGVIASVLSHLEDGPRNDFVRYSIANCSITHMSVTPEETVIHTWNDHSHLDEVMGPIKFEPIDEEDDRT
jgi:broad specificity phosphatase PhoE